MALWWFHELPTQHSSNEMRGATLQASQHGPEQQQQQALLQQPSLPQDPAQVSLPSCCSHLACQHRALLFAGCVPAVPRTASPCTVCLRRQPISSTVSQVVYNKLLQWDHIVCASWQALEILELRDQLQDAHDAIKEAHGNSAGLKEQNVQLETQISRLEQLLADAVR